MAVKKAARKSGKQGRAGKAAPPKVTLPAFGLAEEILGSTGAAGVVKGSERTEELQSASRKPQSEIDPAEARTPQPAADAGPEHHLVTFNLDHEEYGVNIGSVQEIIRVGQITAVPNAPEFVKGVINLRGRVIPVLNLRRRLELSEGKLTKNSRIVVVESGAKVLGLLVDGVSHVLRIPASSVDLPPAESDQTRTYIRAIGKVDSRLIMLMDLDKVLAKDGKAGEPASR
jgi:purine-binding chemotaxis protein CheW